MLNLFQHLHLNHTLCKAEEILNQVQYDNIIRTACGFTLIELLVVVLIIGILAAVALPQYQKAVARSRAVEALIMLKSIIQAQEVYYLANGEYTENLDELDIDIPFKGVRHQTNPFHYYFDCPSSGIRCTGAAFSNNLPTFEARMRHLNTESVAGKIWCRIGNPDVTDKSNIAKQICEQMGEYDFDNYYWINKP